MFTRGVHQTTQIAKTEPKLPVKWHNRTALQVIVYRTTWYSAVWGFIIRKPHKPHPLYILIYLFIFNIKYIINSLITLVFKKKINNHSKYWLEKSIQNKEKLA